jgi:hypothetical protein
LEWINFDGKGKPLRLNPGSRVRSDICRGTNGNLSGFWSGCAVLPRRQEFTHRSRYALVAAGGVSIIRGHKTC